MNDAQEEPEFGDHYYTLGIDIDATGEVVEETYWRLIRAARRGERGAPARPRDIEDLNEAYRVLMTPKLRRAYDEERAEVLGPHAAPRGPEPERPDLPLRVMETQMPALHKEADVAEEAAEEGWSLPISMRLLAGTASALAAAALFIVRWFLF
jgi:curved DNA-binding protein CbpA